MHNPVSPKRLYIIISLLAHIACPVLHQVSEGASQVRHHGLGLGISHLGLSLGLASAILALGLALVCMAGALPWDVAIGVATRAYTIVPQGSV
jgi:hypothetical protein